MTGVTYHQNLKFGNQIKRNIKENLLKTPKYNLEFIDLNKYTDHTTQSL